MVVDDISFEDFQSFVRVRDGGRFNMMTQCGGAAAAEGISVDKHIAIMMNFDALTHKYGAKLEKPAPAKKSKRKKAAAKMTVDERKMFIAYGGLLCIQDLIQHVLRMDADEMLSEDARRAFMCASTDMDKVVADAGRWMSAHTEFDKEKEDGQVSQG